MTNTRTRNVSADDGTSWLYFQLYLGEQMARTDDLLVDLGQRLSAERSIGKWFYLRYADESGFHLRLRVLAADPADRQAVNDLVHRTSVDLLDRIYEYLPTTYQPMVTLSGYEDQEVKIGDSRLRVVVSDYVPEYEKYGSAAAMPIAESVFHLSSELAVQVLADEQRELYSRKTLLPWFMHEANAAFPAPEHPDYWGSYSLYWLGGASPAANDWRRRFAQKGEELRNSGKSILASEDDLPPAAVQVIHRWRDGLREAARAYARLQDGSGNRPDVLSLNFSHLMLNRLGVATLEESYLATLLESQEEVAA